MTLDILLQLSQIAILPALAYLIALERRLVKLETLLAVLVQPVQKGVEP